MQHSINSNADVSLKASGKTNNGEQSLHKDVFFFCHCQLALQCESIIGLFHLLAAVNEKFQINKKIKNYYPL